MYLIDVENTYVLTIQNKDEGAIVWNIISLYKWLLMG